MVALRKLYPGDLILEEAPLVFVPDNMDKENTARMLDDVILLHSAPSLLPPASILLPPASCLLPPASCLLLLFPGGGEDDPDPEGCSPLPE